MWIKRVFYLSTAVIALKMYPIALIKSHGRADNVLEHTIRQSRLVTSIHVQTFGSDKE